MPTFCHAVVIEGSQSLFFWVSRGSRLANAVIACMVAFAGPCCSGPAAEIATDNNGPL
jgi:hypothetical protein